MFAGEVRFFRYSIPFYVWSLIILFLSLLDLMPDSWTRYREPFAAIRHWAWLPILTLTATSCYFFVRTHWDWLVRKSLMLAIGIFVISRMVKFSLGMIVSFDEDFLIYGIVNENAPILALTFVYVHCRADRPWKAIITSLVLLAMCRSQTSFLAATMSLLAFWIHGHRVMLAGSAIACLIFVGGAQLFHREVHAIDPNTSFRALLWRDSSSILADTMGFGVGYGTEYVRNDFRSIAADFDRYIREDAEDRLYLGTHSSLYDVSIRVGIIGLILLLAGFYRDLLGPVISTRLERLRFTLVGAMLFNNVFNMGLASINLTLGTALFLALAVFCRSASTHPLGVSFADRGTKLLAPRRPIA